MQKICCEVSLYGRGDQALFHAYTSRNLLLCGPKRQRCYRFPILLLTTLTYYETLEIQDLERKR
jgi:hypothetical protein